MVHRPQTARHYNKPWLCSNRVDEMRIELYLFNNQVIDLIITKDDKKQPIGFERKKND